MFGRILAGLLFVMATTSTAAAEPAGHITGLGGVFVKSKDPKALAACYRRCCHARRKRGEDASSPYAA